MVLAMEKVTMLPSGKRLHNYGKTQFLMGKHITMATYPLVMSK